MGNRVKAAKQKQKPDKARIAVKTARRAGVISQAKPARPPAPRGRELNDVGDERSWMDWVTPEQIKVAARSPRGFLAGIRRHKRRTRAFQRRTGMIGIKRRHKSLVAANTPTPHRSPRQAFGGNF